MNKIKKSSSIVFDLLEKIDECSNTDDIGRLDRHMGRLDSTRRYVKRVGKTIQINDNLVEQDLCDKYKDNKNIFIDFLKHGWAPIYDLSEYSFVKMFNVGSGKFKRIQKKNKEQTWIEMGYFTIEALGLVIDGLIKRYRNKKDIQIIVASYGSVCTEIKAGIVVSYNR